MTGGDSKEITFNRGKLTIEITERVELDHLAYRFIRQAHVEDRAVRLLDGRIDFEPLAGDRTRVTLITCYQPLMTPRWYWRPFERLSGSDVHEAILNELERSAAAAR
jgi:hypothetical protein